MTNEEFEAYAHGTLEICRNLREIKGASYSVGSDRLENFKTEGVDIGCTALQAAMLFGNKHLRAIKQFIRGSYSDKNEPIQGRVQDAINYLLFVGALIKEIEGVPTPEKTYKHSNFGLGWRVVKKKHKLSEAGRAAIAAAQKKRWAALRREVKRNGRKAK